MVVELGRLAEGNIGNERGIVVYGHVIDVEYPEGQEIGGGERQETVWIERRQGRPLVLESTMLNHRSKGCHQTPTYPADHGKHVELLSETLVCPMVLAAHGRLVPINKPSTAPGLGANFRFSPWCWFVAGASLRSPARTRRKLHSHIPTGVQVDITLDHEMNQKVLNCRSISRAGE